jgi:hypothetical protein
MGQGIMGDSAKSKSSASRGPGPDNRKAQAARGIAASLNTAVKSYSLYSASHEVTQKSLDALKTRIDTFTQREGRLRLTVEPRRLLAGGAAVHQDATETDGLANRLHRDGIEWLEIAPGVELKEITGLIEILHQYRILAPESEGDIVTALWEANFRNIRYSAREITWEAEPVMDLSLPRPGGGAEAALAEVTAAAEADGKPSGKSGGAAPPPEAIPPSITSLPLDNPLWQLTDDERQALREMVYHAENLDDTDSVLDVLMIILRQQSEAEDASDGGEGDVNAILDYLKDEFQTTLENGEFRIAFRLLKSLHEIHQAHQTDAPHVSSAFNDFFVDISGPEILDTFNAYWSRIENLDPARMKAFRQYLMMFHPVAILSFGPMLLKVSSQRTQRLLMEIIASLANRDLEPLVRLIETSDEVVILKIIELLRHLKAKKFTQVILKLTRHASANVRKAALKVLLTRLPNAIQGLFPLLDDPDEAVRWIFLNHLGRQKDTLAESLLLDYLEEGAFTVKRESHLRACYRTLGRCGSDHSLNFLRGILFDPDNGDRFGVGIAVHRTGAALGLVAMGTDPARQALRKAAKSNVAGIRKAAETALEQKP